MNPIPAAPASKRLRLIQALTVFILIVAFAATLWLFFDPHRRAQLQVLIASPIGLAVLFVVALVSNATLILPVPGLALTALAATVANPLAVGIVAGLGQGLGEMTGYLAGYSGQELIENIPRYERMVKWMQQYGALTIFVLAIIPNPLFDLAGIVAGALRMPWWLFLLTTLTGKILKNLALAYAAALGMDWLLHFYGKTL
jgi:membrane protein YqaA with SNARE-associated domain